MWAFLTPGNPGELDGGIISESGDDGGFNCGSIIECTDGLLAASLARFVFVFSGDSSNLIKALGEELDNANRHWDWLATHFGF